SYAVANIIARDARVLEHGRVFNAAVRALGDSGDGRSDRLLDDAGARAVIAALRRAVAAYRASPRRWALDPHEYAERVEATPAIDELWRQLAANPGDLATRAVLGDALLAIGHPRGELFALQLSPARDAPRRARIAALVARFGREWIGGLKSVVRRVVFR